MRYPVVEEELSLLRHVLEQLEEAWGGQERPDYDDALVDLRDAVADAKAEDVAPLVEQMYRVAAIRSQHGRGRDALVDPRSPYFGHMRLQDKGKEGESRDVLIGRSSHVDTSRGVRIVDWRNAPVSRLYYCYDEGDEYQETFGTRPVTGQILARRAVTIADAVLRRVAEPAGTFVRTDDGGWRQVAEDRIQLRGGQGTALRPKPRAEGPRRLGVGPDGAPRQDKHLPEITALIDPRQFELITGPDSGLVVIRGGAGSGKTTVGLHRIAYLGYASPRRYRPDRMLVVVYNQALESYISQVLPSLGLGGVRTVTFGGWASALRRRHIPRLPRRYAADRPNAVSRAKRHPGVLTLLEEVALELVEQDRSAVVDGWCEALTDRELLHRHLGEESPCRRPLSAGDVETVVEWSVRQQRELDDDSGPTEAAWLDPEDDALLLRLWQLSGRRLGAASGKPLAYEHVMVDEAQDLSPVELAVLLDTSAPRASVTLAGDAAQRLDLDSGFESWEELQGDLGLDSLTVTPLQLAYRSTAQIMELARATLGPLAAAEPPLEATRSGAPVELHRFGHDGEAVAMLGEALRDLAGREPLASVAVVARHPERADIYWKGLRRSEVPRLRRVAEQDFLFRPGVEVTDVRQVKGLEFDYVVLVDVDAASYPATDEARHLLHIGATRAAHQLWLSCVGEPSPLLAEWLASRAVGN